MELVIAEKPSVAQSIAVVLGAKQRKDGYLEGNDYLVSWCVGHLVELAQPESYEEAWKKWSYESLPIIPQEWQHEVKSDTKAQYQILKKLMHDDRVDAVVMGPQIICRLIIDILLQQSVEPVHYFFRSKLRCILAYLLECHLVTEVFLFTECHIDHGELQLACDRSASSHRPRRLVHEIVHSMRRSIDIRALVRREHIQTLLSPVFHHEAHDVLGFHIGGAVVFRRYGRAPVGAEHLVPETAFQFLIYDRYRYLPEMDFLCDRNIVHDSAGQFPVSEMGIQDNHSGPGFIQPVQQFSIDGLADMGVPQPFRVVGSGKPEGLREQPAEMLIEAFGDILQFRILLLRERPRQVHHHHVAPVMHWP